MKHLEANEAWSLFDPSDVPELPDLWADAFELAYMQAEARGLPRKTLAARDLYARMMRTLAQTGNGWMTFMDKANRACNQTAQPQAVVHLSNLCTEIIEVTTHAESAVCNLGSINLARHVDDREFDFEKLEDIVELAVRQLEGPLLYRYRRRAQSTSFDMLDRTLNSASVTQPDASVKEIVTRSPALGSPFSPVSIKCLPPGTSATLAPAAILREDIIRIWERPSLTAVSCSIAISAAFVLIAVICTALTPVFVSVA